VRPKLGFYLGNFCAQRNLGEGQVDSGFFIIDLIKIKVVLVTVANVYTNC
jgi:hypothetical protein